jgi:hypothetical protein
MRHCIGVMEPTSIVLEQNRSRRDGAKAPCELPLCKRGLRPFPVFVPFRPVIDGNPGPSTRRRSRPFPVVILQLTGKATGASCARSPVFLLLFTGKQGRRMGQAHARSLIAAGRLAMLAAVQGDNGARSAAQRGGTQ